MPPRGCLFVCEDARVPTPAGSLQLVYNAACVCTSLCVRILPATCCIRKLVPSLIGAHPLACSISKLRENLSHPLTPTLPTSTNPLIATCVHTHFHTWHIVLTQGASRKTKCPRSPSHVHFHVREQATSARSCTANNFTPCVHTF